MQDILLAMAKSGAILVPVVVFIIIISIAAVKRGEASMGAHDLSLPGAHGATAAAAAPAKRETRDATVLEILILSVVAFTLVMGALIGISVLQHMN